MNDYERIATVIRYLDRHHANQPDLNALMARLPNPGAPSATPGMAVLPYSDEIGNPLVVPITNEPLSLTPFAGPDGQAWPAPVPQPNQKLEYPIPPTVLPASKPENQ